MYLQFYTPDGSIYEGEVSSVDLPGSKGRFQVLENHAPLISSLANGRVNIQTSGGGQEHYPIDGGVVEVLKNQVTLLAEGVHKAD